MLFVDRLNHVLLIIQITQEHFMCISKERHTHILYFISLQKKIYYVSEAIDMTTPIKSEWAYVS